MKKYLDHTDYWNIGLDKSIKLDIVATSGKPATGVTVLFTTHATANFLPAVYAPLVAFGSILADNFYLNCLKTSIIVLNFKINKVTILNFTF